MDTLIEQFDLEEIRSQVEWYIDRLPKLQEANPDYSTRHLINDVYTDCMNTFRDDGVVYNSALIRTVITAIHMALTHAKARNHDN